MTGDAEGVCLPVQVDAQHAESEADDGCGDDAPELRETGKVRQPVQQDVGDGSSKGGDGVEVAALKDARGAARKDVSQRAAADRGGDAEHDGGEPGEAEVFRAGRAGDGEERDRRGVNNKHDVLGAVADVRAKEQGQPRGEESGVEVPDVGQGERRSVVQQHVANDAAAKGGDECETERADDVVLVLGVAASVQRPANGPDGDARKVKDRDEEFEMEMRMKQRAPSLRVFRRGLRR